MPLIINELQDLKNLDDSENQDPLHQFKMFMNNKQVSGSPQKPIGSNENGLEGNDALNQFKIFMNNKQVSGPSPQKLPVVSNIDNDKLNGSNNNNKTLNDNLLASTLQNISKIQNNNELKSKNSSSSTSHRTSHTHSDEENSNNSDPNRNLLNFFSQESIKQEVTQNGTGQTNGPNHLINIANLAGFSNLPGLSDLKTETNKTNVTNANNTNPNTLRCRICPSTKGIGFYYGVSQICNSCRMFFRRCYITNKNPNCTGEKLCISDTNDPNFKMCKGCRYKKCLDVGLNSKYIHERTDKSMLLSRSTIKKKMRGELLPSTPETLLQNVTNVTSNGQTDQVNEILKMIQNNANSNNDTNGTMNNQNQVTSNNSINLIENIAQVNPQTNQSNNNNINNQNNSKFLSEIINQSLPNQIGNANTKIKNSISGNTSTTPPDTGLPISPNSSVRKISENVSPKDSAFSSMENEVVNGLAKSIRKPQNNIFVNGAQNNLNNQGNNNNNGLQNVVNLNGNNGNFQQKILQSSVLNGHAMGLGLQNQSGFGQIGQRSIFEGGESFFISFISFCEFA